MEIYIVYELGYTGTNQLEILGAYKNIGEARKIYQSHIDENIKEYDFVVDNECGDTVDIEGTHRMIRLFGNGYQENWDNYLELHIEKVEVK